MTARVSRDRSPRLFHLELPRRDLLIVRLRLRRLTRRTVPLLTDQLDPVVTLVREALPDRLVFDLSRVLSIDRFGGQFLLALWYLAGEVDSEACLLVPSLELQRGLQNYCIHRVMRLCDSQAEVEIPEILNGWIDG